MSQFSATLIIPQMKPMNWMHLMYMTYFSLYMFTMMNFYNMYMKPMNNNTKKFMMMNFKNKW